jgi:hypothetical protein
MSASHGVEREARTDFGNSLGALGHHHEIDDDQDGKDDQSDGEVAADQEMAERLDHLAGRACAGVAFEQHDAGGGDVERQAQQRREKNHAREGREVQRPQHVGRHHHHHQRHRDVEGEQQVQREGRQRQHHHRQDHHHDQRRHRRTDAAAVRAEQRLQLLHQGVHSAASWCGSSSGGTCSSGSSPGIGTRPPMAARSW